MPASRKLINIIDQNGITDSAINEIAERYFTSCTDKNDKTCPILYTEDASVFCHYAKLFLQDLFTFCFRDRGLPADDEHYKMDVLKTNAWSFRASIPKKLIPDDRYNNLMALGPDYLSSVLSPEDIFRYVVPQFFFSLCEGDKFDDPAVSHLNSYMIGLA